ncbi:Uncharacterized protein BM_BM5890 [Brugia malayi]|uniref:Gamma-aminobutyric acid receptor subunit beta n=1 Tax=Brugia malayi TaxID=6279 RepID=A0A4E9F9D0_BRUMA|nr:Uncharacterized protein BM_BM5890 [Brugia malayi]VIO92725.1 Uncharacterized protein BM_BM5890 [Brugia malayi]
MYHISYIFIVYYIIYNNTTLGYIGYPSGTTFNTTAISDILNRLVDKSTYDKRLRPKYGAEPVDVGITIHVSSISAVSEVDMDFTLDFYLRQTWQDPRLAFGDMYYGYQKGKIESLTVGVDYLEKLWKPDTFFPNEKKSFFHTATTHNSFLRIDPDGTVFTSQRLTVTATCPMKLQLFPMDSQKCKLEIESYGYTIATIHYHWCQLKDVHCEAAVKVEPFELTSYRFTSLCINKTIATTSSGSYSRLWAQFLFEREFSFYMIQIYIPAILVVFISWVSFWINPESAPSRTVIGTFTILSETHLLMSTNRRLPPVSYIKAVDVYLGFCYLNVVLALIEYATVTYSRKKYEDEKKNKSKNIFELTPQLQAPDLLQDARIDECTCEQDVSVFVVAKPKCPLKCATFCKHNRVDLIARIVFPVSFLTFNFIYWTVLLSLSKWRIYGDNAEQRAC